MLFMEEPVVDKYTYPKSFIVLGWAINISIFLPIPIVALYQFIQRKTRPTEDNKSIKREINSYRGI